MFSLDGTKRAVSLSTLGRTGSLDHVFLSDYLSTIAFCILLLFFIVPCYPSIFVILLNVCYFANQGLAKQQALFSSFFGVKQPSPRPSSAASGKGQNLHSFFHELQRECEREAGCWLVIHDREGKKRGKQQALSLIELLRCPKTTSTFVISTTTSIIRCEQER